MARAQHTPSLIVHTDGMGATSFVKDICIMTAEGYQTAARLTDQGEHLADLFAAAPELLETGKEAHVAMVDLLAAYATVQRHYGLKPEDSAIYRAAREANRRHAAAIAKATGQAA